MARRRRKSSTCSLLNRQNSNEQVLLDQTCVRYAKRKKAQGKFSIIVQASLLFSALLLTAYTYHCFDHFHFHLTHFFATKWDDHHAQHVLGHKLLKNRSDVSQAAAFQWFRQSANRGHPHSAYNLAAGHLSGFRTDVKKGEVRQLLKYAAKNGVEEAKQLLKTLCRDKPKFCDL